MTGPLTDIRITILGSGTCVPSLMRSSCAVLIQTGGAHVLMDAGPGTMRRLLEADLTIFDISHVFISHFHPDHTGELAPFLFANKYPAGAGRRTALTLAAGSGFSAFFDRLQGVYGRWITLDPGIFHMMELTGSGPLPLDGFTVAWGPVRHSPESLAYRITGPGGGAVVYSGDTDFSEDLIHLAEGADVLICEAAFPDGMKADGHMTPSLAGQVAARANVGKLVLTHFYPVCDTVDMAAQCRKTWDGPLVLAEDLMVVDVDHSNLFSKA